MWLLEEEGAPEMLEDTFFAISEDCPAPPPAPPAGGGAQDAMVIADSDDEGAEVGERAEDKGEEEGQDSPAASQCSQGAGAGAGTGAGVGAVTKAQGGVREVELVKGGAQKQVMSANVRPESTGSPRVNPAPHLGRSRPPTCASTWTRTRPTSWWGACADRCWRSARG